MGFLLLNYRETHGRWPFMRSKAIPAEKRPSDSSNDSEGDFPTMNDEKISKDVITTKVKETEA